MADVYDQALSYRDSFHVQSVHDYLKFQAISLLSEGSRAKPYFLLKNQNCCQVLKTLNYMHSELKTNFQAYPFEFDMEQSLMELQSVNCDKVLVLSPSKTHIVTHH